MAVDKITRDAVLRVGEVTEVSGQRVVVRVDKNKNASDLLFDGDALRNIAVDSYVEIRKGFISLIGRVDGEKLDDIYSTGLPSSVQKTDRNRRFLFISLSGYIDNSGRFKGGLRELPLIGNEVFLVTKELLARVHNLADPGRLTVNFAVTDSEGFEVAFPLDGLFNSHIAIFGNTGSGKSNTLASLYSSFARTLRTRNAAAFESHVRCVLFDFNGEYGGEDCITRHKKVYELSTDGDGDKLPLPQSALLDLEILSILADATEKTQKPFIRRALKRHADIFNKPDSEALAHFKNLLRQLLKSTLQMADRVRAELLLDYFSEILPETDAKQVRTDVEWFGGGGSTTFRFYSGGTWYYFNSAPEQIENTPAYDLINDFAFEEDSVSHVVVFMYVQLISDVLANRAQNDHIAPAINKLRSRRGDIEKVFDTASGQEFWQSNFVVVGLNGVNLEMKKTIPLLLAKRLYAEHKRHRNTKSLTIIVDEAHNVLSTESHREAESWKDYRLETFEEIIKEGRKFGVFVTISSQRPNDISATITSQAHNYFLHRLVNQRDLATVASAVSYLDKLSEAAIPTLPIGTCIFSGVASQIPLRLRVAPLEGDARPRSHTLEFEKILPARG